MSEQDDLDAQVRDADPDRWLASRFIGDPDARADVVALYAFNNELARAPLVASQPLVAEMRLAWWREALAEIFEGRRVRGHPVAGALATLAGRRQVTREALEALVDARLRDLDGWPLKASEALDYVDATAGRLMGLAARVLSPEAAQDHVIQAGRAWGLSGLLRLGGRLPPGWSGQEVRRRVAEARTLAGPQLRGLPVAAFPAAAYATLSGAYANGAQPSELGRRVRLTIAVGLGRI